MTTGMGELEPAKAGPGLLERDAARAAAQVVEAQIDAVDSAAARVTDHRDHEALHDVRVALRRLHSFLRGYRPLLGRAARRKTQQAVRELASATNEGRDAEVQVAWLEAQRGELKRPEKAGLNAILRQRRLAAREGYRPARAISGEAWEQLASVLRGRLHQVPAAGVCLGEALGPLLREQADDLRTRVTDIRDGDQVADLHAARIRAKRLRYLLEPLRKESPEARRAVKILKELQALLGDIHDMHLMEALLASRIEEAALAKARRLAKLAIAGRADLLQRERRRDECVGLAALAARARHRRDDLYERFATTWKPEAAARMAPVLGLADRLAPSPEADGRATAAGPGPGIPVECERKYLLRAVPARALDADSVEIEQGWLPGQQLHERIRSVRTGPLVRYYRTVKLGQGVQRIEVEDETTADVHAVLWPLTKGCRIRKRRYLVPEGSRTWEVDQFLDRDLVLAEIEMESADEEVCIPAWLQPFVVREVTDDPAFVNLSLARSGPAATTVAPGS